MFWLWLALSFCLGWQAGFVVRLVIAFFRLPPRPGEPPDPDNVIRFDPLRRRIPRRPADIL